jgi:plasmid stabilization system protein ParE
MTRTLRILRRAVGDIDDIYDWLRNRSPTGALTWYEALNQRLVEHISGDFLGASAPESTKLGVDLRHAFFKTPRGRIYRVLFLIVTDEIRVLRIRGPGQRPVTKRDVSTDE